MKTKTISQSRKMFFIWLDNTKEKRLWLIGFDNLTFYVVRQRYAHDSKAIVSRSNIENAGTLLGHLLQDLKLYWRVVSVIKIY